MKKKVIAPTNITIDELLQGIRNGKYYTSSSKAFNALGFEAMVCDIKAAEFHVDIRYFIQTVQIPAKKRGNLGKFAGQTVEVICTTIYQGGPRIHFFIRKKV